MTYIFIILMSYFGPNSELLGNIKMEIWQFQKPITDIDAYVQNVSLLLAVDVLSFVINGILLRVFCKVNLVKVLKELQQEFWLAFMLAEAYILMEVRLNYD